MVATAARVLGAALRRGSVGAAAVLGTLAVLAVVGPSRVLRHSGELAASVGVVIGIFALIVLFGASGVLARWWEDRRRALPRLPPG